MPDRDQMPSAGELILYQTEDGRTRVECRLADETLWLSQALMAELFQTTPQNITLHLKSLYEDGEIDEGATCKEYLQVRAEGSRQVRRMVKHYSLDAILAVGYRVRSLRGTQFRRWATERLREYLVKGFAMDDERLKNPDQGVYFDRLLERIRDIRSSEKVFWRKVLEIYATSVDYDSKTETSRHFFATLQNKMHWATHGQTAAEVIVERADSTKAHMGLTHFSGAVPRRSEAKVAKNYLSADELDTLNRIVTAYLEFAELQARQRRPMAMAAWITKLDDFLRLGDREVLTHAGAVSAELAQRRAEEEYELYRQQSDALPSSAEQDMTRALEQAVRALPAPRGDGS